MNITCVKDTGKTKVFELHSKDGNYLLGVIKWYGGWRQYAFMPNADTVFERKCLGDIINFITELMDKRKSVQHRLNEISRLKRNLEMKPKYTTVQEHP